MQGRKFGDYQNFGVVLVIFLFSFETLLFQIRTLSSQNILCRFWQDSNYLCGKLDERKWKGVCPPCRINSLFPNYCMTVRSDYVCYCANTNWKEQLVSKYVNFIAGARILRYICMSYFFWLRWPRHFLQSVFKIKPLKRFRVGDLFICNF